MLLVVMPVSRSRTGKTQVRRTWLQHSVRVHGRRPSYLHQSTQDVPRRVQGHSFQGGNHYDYYDLYI